MRRHHSLTVDRVAAAVERRMSSLDDPGFCIECGNEVDGCEPDARDYPCEHCGAEAVWGANELLMEII